MKKILCGFLALGMVNFCNAQTAIKKDEVKFTPPVIKKNKPKTKLASTAKFTQPVIKKNDEVKFNPPVIKKNKTAVKIEKVKFTPPVIVKDKPTE
jgi:hypothetical protein